MKTFMKSLKEYIAEGLLDRVKNKEVDHEALIKEFIEENYKTNGSYTIKATNKGFIVDVRGNTMVKNKNITSLTNGLFEFGEIRSDFFCDYCPSLKTLEGAPKEVYGYFYCNCCDSLTSLKGAPKEVGRDFDCTECKLLTSLEGAPKEVGGSFNCKDCGVQFTEEDVRKYTNAKEIII